MSPRTRLPARQEKFARLVAGLCTPLDVAYREAGYSSRPEFRRANAHRLLRDPAIVARIKELRGDLTEYNAISLENIQAIAMAIAQANVLDYFEARPSAATRRRRRKDSKGQPAPTDGRLRFKPLGEIEREQGLPIESVKLNDNGDVIGLKLYGKSEALRVLLASVGLDGAGDEASLADIGSRLANALARAKNGEKVIEGHAIEHQPPARVVVDC